MNKEQRVILGVDIGGSHITAGLVDMENKMVIPGSMIRRKVNRYGSAEEILGTWTNTINEAGQKNNSGFPGIGFAMPGPFDYENGICLIKGFDKYESIYGMNIRGELASRLSIEPRNIVFRNDAEAFLEGELRCGSAKGFNHAIGITLGTGLGSASSHHGVTRDAELSVLDFQGEIIEEFVSTRGLIRTYKELSGKQVDEAKAIADLYNKDPHAKETFRIFAHHLAWFLETFIRQESPEVLVIGGNIANGYDLYSEELHTKLADSGISLPKIVLASLGEDALLIGGAWKLHTRYTSTLPK